ncbi:MAG: hypothetical protein E6Q95_00440 [Chitinophagaceae bacterium]|nr:MAG: hypothetical protein E6Q95_00440 [Chitinophagaceae bacterium]
MKKIKFLVLAVLMTQFVNAQQVVDSAIAANAIPVKPIKAKKKFDLSNKASDHIMVQFGVTNWSGKPDSVRTSGFSKSFNVYGMYAFPFKSSPQFSAALGLGIGGDHIVFKNTKSFIDIARNSPMLGFNQFSGKDSVYFKKAALINTYLELPLELRFTSNPEKPNGSFKAAIGAKVGTMIRATTRNRDLYSKSGALLEQKLMKESNKRFFNTTRIAATARIGYGNFSIYGAYQLTNLLKAGTGPELRPYTIGLTLSGL